MNSPLNLSCSFHSHFGGMLEGVLRPRLLATVLMAMMMGGQSFAAESYAPQVGAPHPDFVLPRIDTREPVWLSQFRGKKVLLIQFASW